MTVPDLLDLLDRRCVRIRVDGERIGCRAVSGKVGDDVLDLVRQHKQELIESLKLSNERIRTDLNSSDDGMRTETLNLVELSGDVETWDRRGIENLLAVARWATFTFGAGGGELVVRGPESAVELWRLIREQASGLSRLLRGGD